MYNWLNIDKICAQRQYLLWFGQYKKNQPKSMNLNIRVCFPPLFAHKMTEQTVMYPVFFLEQWLFQWKISHKNYGFSGLMQYGFHQWKCWFFPMKMYYLLIEVKMWLSRMSSSLTKHDIIEKLSVDFLHVHAHAISVTILTLHIA